MWARYFTAAFGGGFVASMGMANAIIASGDGGALVAVAFVALWFLYVRVTLNSPSVLKAWEMLIFTAAFFFFLTPISCGINAARYFLTDNSGDPSASGAYAFMIGNLVLIAFPPGAILLAIAFFLRRKGKQAVAP